MRMWIALLLALAVPAAAAPQSGDRSASARAFVTEFYKWYAPGAGPGIVLAERGATLSDELYRALKADEDAKAKARGEVVGLDYDPFLNSQDPCAEYVAGAVTRRAGAYRVEVFAVCDGKRQARPSVIAELSARDESWAFSDFRDREGRNSLLDTLRALAKARGRVTP